LETRILWAFKVGLFLVVVIWFSFTLYQFGKILQNGIEVPFTDVPATIGFGFRVTASFIAIFASAFYLVKRNFSSASAIASFRGVILCEAAYWLLFLPSGVWGFQYSTYLYSNTFFILETALPCIVEAIVLPTVLIVLFFKINGKKSSPTTIKWTLIAATAYLFVFWFNYTAQWWSEFFVSGTTFLSQSLLYAFEFAITVGGLLFLVIYASIYAKNNAGVEAIAKLNLRKAGCIIVGFGVYFDLILLLGLLFPDAGSALTVWPTFSVGYNADLWIASLPIVGLPLLFFKDQKKNS
jgi:hypothetical protein